MELQDVKWNGQAGGKVLLDADRALQEAVREACADAVAGGEFSAAAEARAEG